MYYTWLFILFSVLWLNTSFKSSTSLNVLHIYICIRIVASTNTLSQNYAVLLKNQYPTKYHSRQAKYNTFTNTRYLDPFTLLTSSSRRVIFLCEETGGIVNTFYTVWLVFWALFHFNINAAQTIFRALLHFELLFN